MLVVEGLNRALLDEKRRGHLEGIRVAPNLNITHLLFVDDILIFFNGSLMEAEKLSKIPFLFCKATKMHINSRKSPLTTFNLEDNVTRVLLELFPFLHYTLDEGIKYLGFRLKPNCYKKEDWNWLLEMLEHRVNILCNRWLSRERRLILVKSVLEAIPVYWMSLDWISKSILEKARKICSNFLWTGKKEHRVLPWVKWNQIVRPKQLGGWGIKNSLMSSKVLAAKAGWRLISTQSL